MCERVTKNSKLIGLHCETTTVNGFLDRNNIIISNANSPTVIQCCCPQGKFSFSASSQLEINSNILILVFKY